ncbi:MAG TPA: hypothetical protein VLA50_06735 [Erythrobacter sp.]|nr:hypothetical protein [Erythrobacter sp.]
MMEKPMQKSLNIISLIGIGAALSLSPMMVLAQDETAPEATPEATAPAPEMTPEQDAAMQALPADKQAAIKAWPAETQAYYWSLSADRQNMFWALADSDKVALSRMAEPQRESAWAQIEAKMMPKRS